MFGYDSVTLPVDGLLVFNITGYSSAICLELCRVWIGVFMSKWALWPRDCETQMFGTSLEHCTFLFGDEMSAWTGADAVSECLLWRVLLERCAFEYMISLYCLWLRWGEESSSPGCQLGRLLVQIKYPCLNNKTLSMTFPLFYGSKELQRVNHIALMDMAYRFRLWNVTTHGSAYCRLFIFYFLFLTGNFVYQTAETEYLNLQIWSCGQLRPVMPAEMICVEKSLICFLLRAIIRKNIDFFNFNLNLTFIPIWNRWVSNE